MENSLPPRPTRCNGRDSFDYEGLKVLAKKLGRPASTLFALSPHTDPFYAGAPARVDMALWFADLWNRLDVQRGIHLRGFHYKLISQREPVQFLDGTPYENTTECFSRLCYAGRDARYLGLVPADGFWNDRKSTSIEHLVEPVGAEISVEGESEYNLDVQAMPALPQLALARPTVAQLYHVELWCEKATINDLLLLLARQYGLNVVTGTGEISATQCCDLVERAVQSERPVRILYVSDFDPAGQSMPVAVARKIEHALYRRGLDLDIQVRPVALTKDQIIEFDIPPIPLKESDRRAPGFRERHGALAAELDALEALHPGALRQILIEEIERYCDPDLEAATEEAASELDQELRDITEQGHEEHRAAIEELTASWAEIATAIEAWKQRAKPVWRAIEDSLIEVAPDPDDHAWPEPAEAEEDDDPLFDSTRGYVEQMDRYKEFQDKPTARRKYGSRVAGVVKGERS